MSEAERIEALRIVIEKAIAFLVDPPSSDAAQADTNHGDHVEYLRDAIAADDARALGLLKS